MLRVVMMIKRTNSIDTGKSADGGREIAGSRISLVQPPCQQRLQLTHVLKAELQRLEPTNGRLRKHVAVEGTCRKTVITTIT